MAKCVSIYAVANTHKPPPLINIVSLSCYEMRTPQKTVTAKVIRLRSCGPIDAYASRRCDADGR